MNQAQNYTIDPETYQNRWWITFTIMLVAVIEVLDTTIVNVSLPDMMGSLGANIDEITWVLTSYIVSAAIFMPLTGFLVTYFGRRRLLLINIVGFVASSVLCGLSMNLPEIVLFRTLQGIFGASLVPISQFVLRDTFPPKEQTMAMAIWGMGIMCAPIFGPTIGGFITENLNWRWIFYINVPVCAIAYFLSLSLIKETPIKRDPIDWFGISMLAIGIGSLQIFLDRGNNVGWFTSTSIRLLFGSFIICISLLIWRCLTYQYPVINLQLFKDRNFTLSTILVTLFVMMVFGQINLSPLMLQTLLNYPSLTAGYMMAPRGVASFLAMAIVGKFSSKLDARITISIGMILAAAGTFYASQFDLDMGSKQYLISSILQGAGMGLFFVPLATLSLATLPVSSIPEGSGLFSFSRSLGMSIGISILTTMISRTTQMSWNTLAGYVQPYSTNLTLWQIASHHNIHDPTTIQILTQQISQQAQMIAFNNIAWLAGIGAACGIPLILLLKPAKRTMSPLDIGH